MRTFAIALKTLSPVFLLVAAMHLVLGLNADAWLGAKVNLETVTEPSLSSQNRFYGVAFALYGPILYICASDLERYEPILKTALVVFFLAGVARLVAWVQHGAPAPLIVALLAIELLMPPFIFLWHIKAKRAA